MFKFIKDALSDNGVPSVASMLCATVILNSLVWVNYLVIKNGSLPDLGGITLFDTGIVGILYGIKKAAVVTDNALTKKPNGETSKS